MLPYLYIDIETARDTDVPDDVYNIAKEKNPDHLPFLPTYNIILCIWVGWMKDWQLSTKCIWGATEKEILENFLRIMPQFTIIWYNILKFDLPMIVLRSLHHWLVIPPQLRSYLSKPWENIHIIDLMDVVKSFWSRYFSLNDISILINIPTSKHSMGWSEVQSYIDQWRLGDIQQYCLEDVRVTYQLHQRLLLSKLL